MHQAKQILVGRMSGVFAAGAKIHYHSDLPDEVFAELSAEELVTKQDRGARRRLWIKLRDRNEALDCLVYCLAAIRLLNPPHWDGPDKRAVVLPPPPTAESAATEKQKPSPPKTVRRQPAKRRRGRVPKRRGSGW